MPTVTRMMGVLVTVIVSDVADPKTVNSHEDGECFGHRPWQHKMLTVIEEEGLKVFSKP